MYLHFVLLYFYSTITSVTSSGLGLQDPPILSDGGAPLWLDGDEWIIKSVDGAVTAAATVPGDVISDLWKGGVIGDPIKDVNWRDESNVWARKNGWRYERMFIVEPGSSLDAASSVLLIFDGLKMSADVYLNNVLISVDGIVDQHLRYEFEVSNILSTLPGMQNNLSIVFPFPSEDKRNDEGRFMAASGAWDWSPVSNVSTPGGLPYLSFGVWKSVYLVPVQTLSLHSLVAHVFYGPSAQPGSATSYPIVPLTDETAGPWIVRVTANVVAGPHGLANGGYFLVSGEWGNNTPSIIPIGAISSNSSAILTIDIFVPAGSVHLWWPNGLHGANGAKQPLYQVNASIVLPGASIPSIIDFRKIGFRVIAIVTDDDSNPSLLQNKTGSGNLTTRIRVNGASIWARGSNFIPLDEFAGRADADAHALQVESAALAGMNILLVWGGGIWQYSAFYDACDAFGILLYHDLMYSAEGCAAHMCQETETQRREITHNVRKLGSHPSIALWASSNELGGGGLLSSFALATVVIEDTSRPVWPASPSRGWAAGVDRLFSRPTGEPLQVMLATPPAVNSTIQTGVYYMGFQGDVVTVNNGSECSTLCGKTNGCVVANLVGSSCEMRGFGFPVSPWGVTWCEAAWPPDTIMPLPLPPAPCDIETHGPYTGGSGWPAINSGDSKTVYPFNPNIPPSLPIPGSQGKFGTASPGLFTSEFGATSFSSFESMSSTLSPTNWGAHGDALYWRSYSQDNIIVSYFGADAVNLSVVGEAAVFSRQLLLSQLASALLIKQTTESIRATNNFGLLLWQLSEIYPTGGWGSLEYSGPRGYPGQVLGGRWKPLHNLLADSLFTDVFIACGAEGQCFVKNDSPYLDVISGSVILEFVSLISGEPAASATRLPINLPKGPAAITFFCASDGSLIGPCKSWSTLLSTASCKSDGGDCILFASVIDNDTGNLLANNQVLLAPPSTLLPSLHSPGLSFELEQPEPPLGSPIRVTVSSKSPALFVTLTTLAQGHFDKNAFFLSPMKPVDVFFIPLTNDGDNGSVYAELESTLMLQSL